MRRRATPSLLAFVLALVLALAFARPSSAAEPGCTVPDELSQVETKLLGLRAHVASGGALRVVAIGDGSTAGIRVGGADLAYPHWLQEALQRAWGERPVVVLNKGVPHQSTEEMLGRFARDALAGHPALVVWETGIVDAVQGIDMDAFAAALRRGIDMAHGQGIDIVLMDMQFSKKATTVIDFAGYLDTIHRVGEVNGIYVFPRYAMMRYWSEQNMFDLDTASKKEEAAVAAGVYRCIGGRLAEAILTASR